MPRTASKKAAKKTPAKRKYVKRATRFFQHTDINIPETVLTVSPPVEEKALIDELTFLDLAVQGIEQMMPDQKSRFMNYIYSRYNQYITLSKLTQ